jgi:hypothetical protein
MAHIIDVPSAEALGPLVAAARDELLAIPDDRIVIPTIDGERAIEQAAALLAGYDPVRERAEGALAGSAKAALDAALASLPALARTYYAADVIGTQKWPSFVAERRKTLSARVREHDRFLFGWATAAFAGFEAAQAELDDIRPGSGRLDDARDAIRVVALFRAWPGRLALVPAVTPERLTESESDAVALADLLGATAESSKGTPPDLRLRAYTRLFEAYNLIRATADFVVWLPPRVSPLGLAGLHPKPRKSATATVEPPETPEEAPVEEPTEVPVA